MKFKTVFILFNLIIAVSFLFVFMLPLFILGAEYTRVFWTANWFLAVFFLLIAAILNTYFGLNWKLFSLLEDENWPELVSHLEEKIYSKKRYTRHTVRMLIHAYVVQAQPEAITKLEHHVRSERPAHLKACAVEFGIPYLLRNNPGEMVRYYSDLAGQKDVNDHDWVRWSHGFSLLLAERQDDARIVLTELEKTVKEPVLRALTLYVLEAFSLKNDEIKDTVAKGLAQLRKEFTLETWQKELDKNKGNLQVLVLSKLLREATGWIFPDAKRTKDDH